MILCLGATPALQRTMVFEKMVVDSVNRATETHDGLAGKSINVAKVLKTLGEEPLALGFIGGERGDKLKRELDARGIDNQFVQVDQPTRECITVIDGSAGAQTELVEESKRVSPNAYALLLKTVRKHSGNCKALIMSGTLTPEAPGQFYLKCARLARAAGALVVVDAKGPPMLAALRAELDVVKPNRSELEATCGKPLKAERDLKAAMRDLHERGARNVIVTDGSRPTLVFDGKHFWRIHSPRVKALNPIGSGDSFTAGLVWRLVKGESLPEACRWAAACGAANALTVMAAELTLKSARLLRAETRVEQID